MNIRLCTMTEQLCREFFRDFQMDPVMFADMSRFRPYAYSAEDCDARVQRYRQLGRVYLAVMLGERAIGEVVLKNIDPDRLSGTLGIHLQNDSVKNHGYGTAAEILALRYAFGELHLQTVYADALIQNTRSRHVLEKVGFRETHRDDTFVYYRCDQRGWEPPQL